jgi:hypothetical protein
VKDEAGAEQAESGAPVHLALERLVDGALGLLVRQSSTPPDGARSLIAPALRMSSPVVLIPGQTEENSRQLNTRPYHYDGPHPTGCRCGRRLRCFHEAPRPQGTTPALPLIASAVGPAVKTGSGLEGCGSGRMPLGGSCARPASPGGRTPTFALRSAGGRAVAASPSCVLGDGVP